VINKTPRTTIASVLTAHGFVQQSRHKKEKSGESLWTNALGRYIQISVYQNWSTPEGHCVVEGVGCVAPDLYLKHAASASLYIRRTPFALARREARP
jgi:hypothetical protein